MKVVIVVLLGLGIVSWLICSEWLREPTAISAPDSSSTARAPSRPTDARPSTPTDERNSLDLGDWEIGVPSWKEEAFRQQYTVRDFRFVEVLDQVHNSQTGAWDSLLHTGSSSFDILRVASAKKDLLCFAGIASNGDFVLERWKLIPRPQRPGLGGVLQPNEPITLNGLIAKDITKAEIFRGPLAPEVIAVGFDAEARFMLALLKDGEARTLYRFDNQVSATPEVLLDSNVIPELAQVWDLAKFDHAMLGRVWTMEDRPGYTLRIMLIDSDNDGEFEGPPVIGDRPFFELNGIEDYELWDSLLGPP